MVDADTPVIQINEGDFPTDAAHKTDASPAGATAEPTGKVAAARQVVSEGASSIGQQAADKARSFAEDGKAKATGLLEQLAQMLTDAAGQVDDKLGAHYGGHARTAASAVQGFADTVRDKPVDDIADEVRGYIKRSPAAAIGVTAALGFALARIVHAGLDQRA